MRLVLCCLALAVSACTIQQDVSPVAPQRISQLCVQENTAVAQAGFEPALIRQIEARGITALPVGANPPEECAFTMTYTAFWQWDLALYLEYADLVVLEEGAQIGRATYNARSGSANLDKFGRTEDKIAVLVTQLFP